MLVWIFLILSSKTKISSLMYSKVGFSVGKIGMLYSSISIHTYKIFCLAVKIGYLCKAEIAKFAHFVFFEMQALKA